MRNIFKGESAPSPKRSQITALITGVLVAYAVTCTAFIACAMALTYTGLSESAVPMIITIACVVSVFIAGFDASRASERNGWMWGLIAGGIYAFILFCVLSWVSKGIAFDIRSVTLIVLSAASGGVGGIVGINFQRK
jgi:putative membrane protein (TIGR04086 family)